MNAEVSHVGVEVASRARLTTREAARAAGDTRGNFPVFLIRWNREIGKAGKAESSVIAA